MTNQEAAERQAGYACRDAQCRALVGELVEALKACAAVCAGETVNKNGLVSALEKARTVLEKAKEAMKP